MIIIGGPTASGKTSIAAEIAQKLNGEIVSADSMQIYKGMDIGTAKASDEELGVKQHLIDIVEPYNSFSVVDYREKAVMAIRDIESRNKLPIIAGGTGFYISSLLTEYSYGSESDPEIRSKLNEELERFGREHIYAKLKALDPVSSEKIHFNNVKRVLRALEVCLVTGKSFSDQQNIKYNPVSPYVLFVLSADRKHLYEKIEQRVDVMINSGLENEVKMLIETKKLDFDMQSMQGIGYKEWKPYLNGDDYSVSNVADAIKKNTKAYAKRQQTWFAHQYKDGIFLDGNDKATNIADKAVEYYNMNINS